MDSPNPPCHLLSLSDELLLLIVQQLDRHDEVPNFWMTCKKFKAMSEPYMYRNTMITLPEQHPRHELIKLILVPNNVQHIKHLTILNQCRDPDAFFYRTTITTPHSYRILRWQLLENAGHAMNKQFGQSAFLAGRRFDWNVKLSDDQLVSFRWRHAIPLSIKHVGGILVKNAGTIAALELSMIQPPAANSVSELESAIHNKEFPKLRKLTYDGLSHTEPIPQNNPEKGGRFRMLRPIFRQAYKTLEELTLSQDHCISQIGKTPLINGRTFDAFLCDLDELYVNPRRSNTDVWGSADLTLSKLELGGFKVAKLFNKPSLPTISPRVRIELPSLRRLVLNDCDGLGRLLQDMQARKEEINLAEIGFRIVEDEEAFEDFAQLADIMKSFLLSFKSGVRVLSVLWEGANAPETSNISAALSHHSETLEVYNFAAREGDNDEDMDTTLRFISKPQACSPWTPVFTKKEKLPLRELGLNLSENLLAGDYAYLRLLSQFELRTVHIRNFPPLKDGLWRDQEGSVSQIGRDMAAKFAEYLALPFYALPKEIEDLGTTQEGEDMADWNLKLKSVAEKHTAQRDESLGCIKLKSIYSSSAPTRDISRRIIEQRAATDAQFARIMHKVKTRKATAKEHSYYNDYVQRVQTTLGLIQPDPTDAPKLRLLIVGDWRYRDQMNLTGPRTWDPNAWCTDKGPDLDINSDLDDPDSEDGLHRPVDVHGGQQYRLRYGFRKEWDVCLLPIFFRIEWRAEQGKEDKKWRWRAGVRVLEQSTLEGYGALGDVRSLDFAFQN